LETSQDLYTQLRGMKKKAQYQSGYTDEGKDLSRIKSFRKIYMFGMSLVSSLRMKLLLLPSGLEIGEKPKSTRKLMDQGKSP
jgi:hypothetical protein